MALERLRLSGMLLHMLSRTFIFYLTTCVTTCRACTPTHIRPRLPSQSLKTRSGKIRTTHPCGSHCGISAYFVLSHLRLIKATHCNLAPAFCSTAKHHVPLVWVPRQRQKRTFHSSLGAMNTRPRGLHQPQVVKAVNAGLPRLEIIKVNAEAVRDQNSILPDYG